jgi:hypothetical protein
METMTSISKLSEALGSGWIFGALSGAAIVALLLVALAPTAKEKKVCDQVVSTLFHHHRCDRATARDVSNPPAGLQDQHATRNRHVTERPGKYNHAVPLHALRQYATLTGDKAACSDTLFTDHSPCR